MYNIVIRGGRGGSPDNKIREGDAPERSASAANNREDPRDCLGHRLGG